MRPLYRSTATLLIEQGKAKIVSIEEVYSQGLMQREYYQTQVEILKSDELARKVVRKLEARHPSGLRSAPGRARLERAPARDRRTASGARPAVRRGRD